MTFQDRSQPDPSQPLTLDRPQTDPSLPPPYPQRPQYARAQMPPQVFMSNTTQPRRDPNDWGGEHWPITATANNPGMPGDQNMPSGLEAYPTMAKSGGYLAQNGSDNINQNAQRVSSLAMGFSPLLDMLSSGAFSRGFNESSLNHIKIKQAQLAYEGEQLQFRHAQELADYGEIFAKADAITKDPRATQAQKVQAIEDAREELRFLAETKYGHHRLTALLDTHGGLDVAKQFLSDEDAYFRDAWASTTSLKKVIGADRDTDTAKEFGISPQAGIGHGGGIFGRPLDAEAAETDRDTQAPAPSASDYDRDVMRKTGTTPEELAMARQASMGQTPESYKRREKIPAASRTPTENKALSDVDRLANQLSRDVEGAANIPNPSNDPVINKKKLDRLQDVNPALAAEIAGLGTYNLDPKGEDRIGDRRYINSLVSRFFPDYNSDNYAVMKKYKDESSPSRKILTQAGAALQPISEFLKALKPIPETDSVPIARIREWMAGNVENTGNYRELSIAAQQMAQRLSAITTGSGVTRVSIFNKRMNEMQGYVSPKVLRSILKQEAADIWGSIGPYQNTWETTFKRDDIAPGITKKIWQGYGTILLMNPNTGQMPPGAPPEWAAVSKNATKGVKPEETWIPMSPADQRKNYLEAQRISKNPDLYNPRSPNYAKLQHDYQELLSRELSIVNAPWERPDMD